MKKVVFKQMTDEEIKSRESDYFDKSDYSIIIKGDCDCYKEDGTLLFKFRKGLISNILCKNAIDSFRKKSKLKKVNRGASAGNLSMGKMPNYVGKFLNPSKFRTHIEYKSGKIGKTNIGNIAKSNIIGYYDVPLRGKSYTSPCRETVFNLKQPELW